MAKKTADASPLSSFDSLISNISGGKLAAGSIDPLHDDDDDDVVVDLSLKNDEDKAQPSDDDVAVNDTIKVPANATVVAGEDDENEGEEIPETEIPATDPANEGEEDNDPIDEESESGQVGLLFDAFSEALGWEAKEGEEKPASIDGLIKYMQDLIEEESVPTYSNDQVKELDEFIANGGKFEDYYKAATELTNLETIDLTDDTVQKTILRESLSAAGQTQAQIDRKIKRWEEAGTLEEEAEDAVESLKEHRSKEQTKMVTEQKEKQAAYQKQQSDFYEDVTKSIDSLKEIRNIKVPAEDRQKLKDYAFKVESDGTTRYQKDFGKNLTKNFIESAYFTMKGDALMSAAKKTGESSAVAKLRASMKNGTPGKSKRTIDNGSATPIWKAASSAFGIRT